MLGTKSFLIIVQFLLVFITGTGRLRVGEAATIGLVDDNGMEATDPVDTGKENLGVENTKNKELVVIILAFLYFREDSEKSLKNRRRKNKLKRLESERLKTADSCQNSNIFTTETEVLVNIEMSPTAKLQKNPLHDPNISYSGRRSNVRKFLRI